jgi:hypothetical protein
MVSLKTKAEYDWLLYILAPTPYENHNLRAWNKPHHTTASNHGWPLHPCIPCITMCEMSTSDWLMPHKEQLIQSPSIVSHYCWLSQYRLNMNWILRPIVWENAPRQAVIPFRFISHAYLFNIYTCEIRAFLTQTPQINLQLILSDKDFSTCPTFPMMSSTYPITGIPVPPGAQIPVRTEICIWSKSDKHENRIQVSLFIRALRELQEKDTLTDQLSFYRLAGMLSPRSKGCQPF